MTRTYTVAEIAEALGADLVGDGSFPVRGLAEPADAGADELALAMAPRYLDGLAAGGARAAVLWDGADVAALDLVAAIVVPRPRYAMAGLTAAFDEGPGFERGVHPSAVIEEGASLGADAAIGPFAHIRSGARVGPGARIGSHVSIGRDTVIGAEATLHAGVRIGHGVTAGDRLIVQSNAVIGGDGFSFVTPERGAVEVARESLGAKHAEGRTWSRIHSLGAVRLGDDVEVGAGTTIDRGTVRDTVIGRGTKIDNLVMVAHNVRVGEDCLFAGQVGIAGSTVIGDRVVLGGKVGVSDNVTIGSDVVAGGYTFIAANVPGGRAILGVPSTRMNTQVQIIKAVRRLPRLFDRVGALEKALSKASPRD